MEQVFKSGTGPHSRSRTSEPGSCSTRETGEVHAQLLPVLSAILKFIRKHEPDVIAKLSLPESRVCLSSRC